MMRLTEMELSARNRRSVWIAVALVGFIVMIFMTTFLRMQHNSQMFREANLARSAAPASQTAERPGVRP